MPRTPCPNSDLKPQLLKKYGNGEEWKIEDDCNVCLLMACFWDERGIYSWFEAGCKQKWLLFGFPCMSCGWIQLMVREMKLDVCWMFEAREWARIGRNQTLYVWFLHVMVGLNKVIEDFGGLWHVRGLELEIL
jgi:hypothetical protein